MTSLLSFVKAEQLPPVQEDSVKNTNSSLGGNGNYFTIKLNSKNSSETVTPNPAAKDTKKSLFHIDKPAFSQQVDINTTSNKMPSIRNEDDVQLEIPKTKKESKFSFSTSFHATFNSSSTSFGENIRIGRHLKNFYGGFNILVGWGPDWVLGGGGEFMYEYTYKDIFAFDIGAVVGFWWSEYYYYSTYYYSYSYEYSYYEYIDDFYFGGPALNFRIGKKHVFLVTDNYVTFGTGGALWSLGAGLEFVF